MAGITGGARVLEIAETATKAGTVGVLDASIRGVGRASVRPLAGKAEVTELGHTHVLAIATRAYQRAVPALRAKRKLQVNGVDSIL